MDKLISQQAAIDTLKELTANGTNKGMVFGEDAVHRIEILPSAQPDIIRCKDCKHWKDSDGVYRRGLDAESKCPLNLKEVYEGTFFCGMAERREDGCYRQTAGD